MSNGVLSVNTLAFRILLPSIAVHVWEIIKWLNFTHSQIKGGLSLTLQV